MPGAVSAIIPAYNAAACVARAILSAIEQTHPPREIIVVDDGSEDGTADVAAAFPAPVRLVRRRNGGPAAARNTGARAASGSWLAYLDADDSWMPEKIERQLAAANRPGIGLIHSRAKMLDGSDPPEAVSFADLWKKNFISSSTVFIRREAFFECGGFNEDLKYAEDYNLWLRMAASPWSVVTVREDHYRYTSAPGSLSSHTERFARAELANVEDLRARLGLPPAMAEAKRTRIFEVYGRDLFYERNLQPAREFLRQALIRRPSAANAAYWIATFLPKPVLSLRRQLLTC